jgi:uncharacterized membrane protein YuzA (DUF378 family)
VLATAGYNFHLARQGSIVIGSGVRHVSGYLRYINNRWVGILCYDGTASAYACFDLLNGVVGSKTANVSASTLTATGLAGVYKFTFTTASMADTSAGICDIELRTADGTGAVQWNAVGGEAVGAWGMKMTVGSGDTSPIDTTTTSVTRAVDALTYTGVPADNETRIIKRLVSDPGTEVVVDIDDWDNTVPAPTVSQIIQRINVYAPGERP